MALTPILEAAVGQSVLAYEVTIPPDIQPPLSGCADTRVAAFTYTTHTGQGHINIFVKRFFHRGSGEATALALLHEYGFPTPRLYGTMHGSSGEEIVFQEWLDPIAPRDSEDPGDRRTLLSLHARLNALPIQPSMASRPLPSLWYDGTITNYKAAYDILNRTWHRAQDGELGVELRGLCFDLYDVERLAEHAEHLREQIAAMPLALTNQEMGFGYRPMTGEALAFDWHTLFVGPRMGAVEASLGAPPYVQSGFGGVWLPKQDYAEYYASELVRCGGSKVSAEDIIEEAHILWLAGRYTGYMSWWADRSVNDEQCREQLAAVIRVLLEEGKRK